MKKFYEILGLEMSASIEEIAQAYKELSETWNPQNYQNLPRYRRKAEIKSKEINEAYERISAFLSARTPQKARDADQTDQVAPEEPLPESEPQTATPEEAIPPQISKVPQRKTLFYGLIAIALVLGILVFYQISDRKRPAQPGFQTAVTGEEKPTPATASQSASTAPLQKESVAQPAGESDAASTDTKHIAPRAKIDYNALLTEESLDKYNQDPARVERAQRGLVANGYDTGPLDGIIGTHTTAALKRFASDHALGADSLYASNLSDAVLLYAEVAATHPDWQSIMGSDDFERWLDRQSYYQTSTIQHLRKTATAQQVIDILNRYKSDKQ
jgi:peptidoglycan hydrolase-like protein with peptidoglycan-binding domain